MRDSGWIGGGGVKYFRGSVFINHSYIILLLPHQDPPSRQMLPFGSNDQAKKKKWEGRTVGSESSDANLEPSRACESSRTYHIHTYMHTYIHTYTYINKYIINIRPGSAQACLINKGPILPLLTSSSSWGWAGSAEVHYEY